MGRPAGAVSLSRAEGWALRGRVGPTVQVGAWALVPHRTREAERVGADAGGGGCARRSRSTSERLDCVRECGKQGQQLSVRVGAGWGGGGEIVRSSHPRTGRRVRRGLQQRACLPWAHGWVGHLPLLLPGLPGLPGSPTRPISRCSLLWLPQERTSSFLQHFLLPFGQPAFEFAVTHLLGKLGHVFSCPCASVSSSVK